ncbi:BTAD domain-containing putative transcriptional regulator [Phytohabitans flavus]|uniref:SARP family transcriptional regulator n=1 Tax=Phytohabitans flavus TaxID=1076124 RepID=A0A6F8XLM8_9ACTN|nr:BTAD domain-containing putative transcriptional regulator [Phytohabitans flavus]BCB74722.1 SARP family transcriptional regulator [Phytohabitans flavus]
MELIDLMRTAPLRFSVLGPVGLAQDGEPIDLGTPQQRAILALLLVRAGRWVGAAEFVELLWASDPPPSATNLVHRHISTLRRVFEPDLATRAPGRWLLRDGNGYRLTVGAADLDLLRFRELVDQANEALDRDDPARGATLFVEALGLWTNACASGLESVIADPSPFRAIDQERSAAAVTAADAALLSGRSEAVLPAVRAAAAADRLNEPLQARLLRLLGAVGQQGEALRLYRGLSGTLADELGIEPGAVMYEARMEVLRQTERSASTRDRPIVRPAQLPTDLRTFGGRRHELAQLADVLDRLSADGPGVITIDGMPGTGKTTLAVHWARRQAERYPDGQLYVDLRGFAPDAAPLDPAEVLRGFLDALGLPPRRIPDSVEAQARLFREVLAGRRVMVVLDNARDSDHVRHLLPGSPGNLAIVTSRRSLTGLATAHQMTLAPLSPEEARETLVRRLGSTRLADAGQAVDQIIAYCAGLPLALAIVAARAVAHPGFPLDAIADELARSQPTLDALRGGTDVRAVFSWSYRMLDPSSARLFRLLQLHIGPDVSVPVAASLLGGSPAAVREQLAELARNHLITESHPGTYRMHGLVRGYALDLSAELDSAKDRQSAVGRMLDHYLHTAHAAHALLRPQREPIPLPPARPEVVILRPSDYSQAMDWFSAHHRVLADAVGRSVTEGLPSHAWRLALALQPFYQRSGHLHQWESTARIAVDGAVAGSDVTGEAHTRRSLAGALNFQGRYDEALAELARTRDLYAQLGLTADQAYVDINFGTVLGALGRFVEAIGHHQQARERFRVAGHRVGEANAIVSIGWCRARLGELAQAAADARAAMRIYEEVAEQQGVADCWANLGDVTHRLGRYPEAAEAYGRAIDLFRALGHRADQALALVHQGDSQLASGRRCAAWEAWTTAWGLLDGLNSPLAGELRRRLDSLGEPDSLGIHRL